MKPIQMILHCPECGTQHVDAPEPDKGWTNPPHKSHLCHSCHTIWRPADVPTNGVARIATRGENDSWPLPSSVTVTSSGELQCWFNLSYASFLTLPRVLMEAMPIEWQNRIAALLKQYDMAFPNQPDLVPYVTLKKGNRFVKTPDWLINYRRPNREAIDELRRQPDWLSAVSGDTEQSEAGSTASLS